MQITYKDTLYKITLEEYGWTSVSPVVYARKKLFNIFPYWKKISNKNIMPHPTSLIYDRSSTEEKTNFYMCAINICLRWSNGENVEDLCHAAQHMKITPQNDLRDVWKN